MSLNNYKSIIYLLFILLFSNFQCKEEPLGYGFILRDWQPALLDNSGADPAVSDNPILRTAFGFRLNARMTSDGLDTILALDPAVDFPYALQPLKQIEVFAANGFDDVAAGENISARFRLRDPRGSSLYYYPLDNAYQSYNQPYLPVGSGYFLDILMLDPPAQPGAYQFAVKISFDSTSLNLNNDTLFTLPPVTLQ